MRTAAGGQHLDGSSRAASLWVRCLRAHASRYNRPINTVPAIVIHIAHVFVNVLAEYEVSAHREIADQLALYANVEVLGVRSSEIVGDQVRSGLGQLDV